MTNPWGGGMLGKLSKLVILCYYVSIFYLNNCFENIQNIKIVEIVVEPLCPLVGEECGVTHQL